MLAERMARFRQVDIYPVTCEELSLGRTNIEILRAVIEGDARIIQLRDKVGPKRAIYQQALIFRQLTREHHVLLIINDHVDIALSVDADGVHLGQHDLPVEAARALAPNLIIGTSTHNLQQALDAQRRGASYVNIGPIFETKTKEGASDFLGPRAISDIGPRLDIPFTVMGGVNPTNLDQVLERGALRVAMVTGITEAEDVAARVRELASRIRQHHVQREG